MERGGGADEAPVSPPKPVSIVLVLGVLMPAQNSGQRASWDRHHSPNTFAAPSPVGAGPTRSSDTGWRPPRAAGLAWEVVPAPGIEPGRPARSRTRSAATAGARMSGGRAPYGSAVATLGVAYPL